MPVPAAAAGREDGGRGYRGGEGVDDTSFLVRIASWDAAVILRALGALREAAVSCVCSDEGGVGAASKGRERLIASGELHSTLDGWVQAGKVQVQ